MRIGSFVLGLVALVGVAGCSGGKHPPPPPHPDGGTAPKLTFSLSLQQSDLGLRQGTSAVVNFSLSAANGVRKSDATVKVTGAGSGVTASAGPVGLSGWGSVDFTASGDAPATTRTVTIAVSGDGASAAATLPLTVTAFSDVEGMVEDQSGAGVGNAMVRSGSAQAHTGGDGSFRLPNVPLPYDLDIVTPDGRRGYRFAGVDRRDPTFAVEGGQANQGVWTVDGTLAGAWVPPPQDGKVAIALDAPGTNPLAQPVTLDGNAFETLTFPVPGPGALAVGNLVALETKVDADGNLAGYYASGSHPVEVMSGKHLSGASIRLALLRAGTFGANVTVPDGYQLTHRESALLPVGGNAIFPLGDDTSGAASFLIPAPDNSSGFTLRVTLVAEKGSQRALLQQSGLVASDSPLPLAVPAAPAITPPATPVTTDTDFAWTDTQKRVYLAAWEDQDPGGSMLFVVTTAQHATIPDLTDIGFLPPASRQITFGVLGQAVTTMQEATSPGGLRYGLIVPGAQDGTVDDGAVGADTLDVTFSGQ